MFSARVDPAWLASPTDWRLVSLDVFDGSNWTTDAHAVRAGTVLDVAPGVDASRLGPSSTDQVSLTGLTGPWVPTTGVPTGVRPADLAYDPATSILIASPSAQGRTFTVMPPPGAVRARPSTTAGVTVSTANAALTQVPACFPTALSQLATQAAVEGHPSRPAGARHRAGPGRRPQRLHAPTPAATPGSSCGRLKQFATAKQGTAEQFATACVLMARTVGLPARLAVGFLPGAVATKRRAHDRPRLRRHRVAGGRPGRHRLGRPRPHPRGVEQGGGGRGVGAVDHGQQERHRPQPGPQHGGQLAGDRRPQRPARTGSRTRSHRATLRRCGGCWPSRW